MPIVARTRFVAGIFPCEVRTYEIRSRSGEVVSRFSIGAVNGLDVVTSSRTIDAIRAVRLAAERASGPAGRSNTGRCLMGETFRD